MLGNKKGDLPVTILVIGVFAVCSLALITFFISDLKTVNSFGSIDLMENISVQINQYNYFLSQGTSIDLLEQAFNVKEEKLIVKENEMRFTSLDDVFSSGEWRKKVLLFSVEYKIP